MTAKAVILAPGVEARKLGVPGEAEFLGRGVSYCATCDGALYRDKEVVVIGGGDSAVEEGLFLAKFASTVHVIHRRDELRAQKIAQERAFANPKMHFIWNSQVRRIAGETKVEGVDYQNVIDKSVTTLPAAGVFFYVGQLPNTAFLQGVVDLDESGYILTDAAAAHQPGRPVRLRRRARRPHQADRQRRRRGRARRHRDREVPRHPRVRCRSRDRRARARRGLLKETTTRRASRRRDTWTQ